MKCLIQKIFFGFLINLIRFQHSFKKDKYIDFLKTQTYLISFYYDYRNKEQPILNHVKHLFIKICISISYILKIIHVEVSISVSGRIPVSMLVFLLHRLLDYIIIYCQIYSVYDFHRSYCELSCFSSGM